MTTDTHPEPLHVLIAGGGVAALEAMMALRALAADRVRITLLAPGRDFHYRPLAVAEPFTIDHARRVPLAGIAGDFDARLVTGTLAAVEAGERRIVTSGGARIAYDALVIACGTRSRPAFEHVSTVDDRNLGGTLRGLVQDVEEGYTSDIAFVAPAQACWPLPLYELALLTAHRAYDMNVEVDISIVTPEIAPLALFGAGISDELSRLLAKAGIAFHGSSFAQYEHGTLKLASAGLGLRPQRVVALPLLEGPQIAGIPGDPHGFIPVSQFGAVDGLDDVYAAGDATTYPIKHGGVASQQADIVAEAITSRAGLTGDAPRAPRPVIRGVLLNGGAPRFFEAVPAADRYVSTVTTTCPWESPAKIAARHLGAYLARRRSPALAPAAHADACAAA